MPGDVAGHWPCDGVGGHGRFCRRGLSRVWGYPRLARLLASAAYRNRQGSDRLDHQTFLHGLAWLEEEDGGADNFVKENI